MKYEFDFQKHSKFLLILIFVIGFLVRSIFIHNVRLDYDEGLFLFIGSFHNGSGLIDGIVNNFPNQSGGSFNQPPLVSTLYSLLYSFFPVDYAIGRFINVLLSSLCIFIVYLIIKELYDQKVALVGAIMTMIDPTFVMEILMTMDGLTILIFCISCFTIVKAIKKDTFLYHLIAGVSFGLCMLTKWTLAIVPISYVVFYMYHSIWVKKQDYIKTFKYISASAGIALMIFLPWFLWMGLNGNFPIIFGHTHNIRLTNPFNSIFQTWTNSPILFLLAIYSFLYYFLNQKQTRFFLLYGLFMIFPFFLLLPRYYDYSPVLYLFVLLGAKQCTFLFNQSYTVLSELKKSKFKFINVKVDPNILLGTTIIILLIGANSGFIIKQALFDQDQTIQQSISFINSNVPEEAVVVSPPHVGALVSPRDWKNSLHSEIGDDYYLVFSPNVDYYNQIFIDGVENGFTNINSNVYLFDKIATINDVLIYRITLN